MKRLTYRDWSKVGIFTVIDSKDHINGIQAHSEKDAKDLVTALNNPDSNLEAILLKLKMDPERVDPLVKYFTSGQLTKLALLVNPVGLDTKEEVEDAGQGLSWMKMMNAEISVRIEVKEKPKVIEINISPLPS